MKKRYNFILIIGTAACAFLLHKTSKVAALFKDPDEARQYRVRQSILSAAASAAGTVLVIAAVHRTGKRKKEIK